MRAERGAGQPRETKMKCSNKSRGAKQKGNHKPEVDLSEERSDSAVGVLP